MFTDPLGYFLTFTVKGSWLHGDARGSFSRDGFIVPDPNWVRMDKTFFNGQPFLLTHEQRMAVDFSLKETAHQRCWILHERNVRTNHVHLVVTAPDLSPERVMNDFKAKATRALRKNGLFPEDQKVWTRHGSTIYLFTENVMEAACRYVREGQDKP